MQELSAEDRYQLRKLQMDVDKKGLEVQKAQQDLDRLVLELEHRYGLLSEGGTIDSLTGAIKGSALPPVKNGKGCSDPLLAAAVGEAA